MINRKPTSVESSARNMFGPRADKLALCLPLYAGSGTALANVGARTSAPWDVPAIVSGDWAEDEDEGAGIRLNDGATNQYIHLATATEDLTFPRGTILIRLRREAIVSQARIVLNVGVATSPAGNTMRIVFQNQQLQVIKASNDVVSIYVLDGQSEPAIYTVLMDWGERGFHAWVNGVAMEVQTGSPTEDVSPLVIPNGRQVRIGNSATPVLGVDATVFAFAWWDWQLHERERAELFNDPYLPFRPLPSDTVWQSQVNPIPGCVTQTSITFQNPAPTTIAESGAGSKLGLRVLLDDRQCLRETPLLIGEATVEHGNENQPITIDVTGLHPDVTYHWLAQYAVAETGLPIPASAWRNFPGGCGRFVSQPAVERACTIAFTGDDHGGNGLSALAVDDVRFGMDIEGASADDLQYALWRMTQDIYERTPDVIVMLGDCWYSDGEPTTSRMKVWLAAMYQIFKTAVVFFVLGNHEGEGGHKQYLGRQCIATAVRKRFIPGPRGGVTQTYPEGGEFESGGWPEEGNNWIPPKGSMQPVGLIDDTYWANNISGDPLNQSPLENYYALTWGGALLLVLDAHRYGGVATAGTTSVAVRQFGAAQKTWATRVLRTSNAPIKLICLHEWTGGTYNDGDSLKFYGRGSGVQARRNRHRLWSADAYSDGSVTPGVGIEDEAWLLDIAKQCGVTALMLAHDHVASLVQNDTVNVVHVCTGGTLQFVPASYGERATQGADKAAEGLKAYYRVRGYVEFVLTGHPLVASARIRVTSVAKGDPFDNATADDGTYNTSAKYMPRYSAAAGATAVDLGEAPKNVLAVVNEADGDWASDPSGAGIACGASDWMGTAVQLYSGSPFTGPGAHEVDAPWPSSIIVFDTPAAGDVRVLAYPFTIDLGSLGNAIPSHVSDLVRTTRRELGRRRLR